VRDLGGAAALRLSLLDVGDGWSSRPGDRGDTNLGGDDLRRRIVDDLADAVQRRTASTCEATRRRWHRLFEAAEKDKVGCLGHPRRRSNAVITADGTGPKNLNAPPHAVESSAVRAILV